MTGLDRAARSWGAAAALGAIATFAAATAGVAPARALPPASGSKCTADWVNNQAAMSCFIRGEEESRSGARHPHYVACTAAGEVFCCVDNDAGAQDCEVAVRGRPAGKADWTRAVLAAHRSMTMSLGRYTDRPVPPHSRAPEAIRKAP